MTLPKRTSALALMLSSILLFTAALERATGAGRSKIADTPSFLAFVRGLRPAPKSAAEVYRAVHQAGHSLSDQVATFSNQSEQAGDVATNQPRTFVTIDEAVECSTGPEGTIEVATFPKGVPAASQIAAEDQWAEVSFDDATGNLEIVQGYHDADCFMCHDDGHRIEIGHDNHNEPMASVPGNPGGDPKGFRLSPWYDENCGTPPKSAMCRTVREMLGRG